jgi:glycosyltransferase involved in cell wall biosynthesis
MSLIPHANQTLELQMKPVSLYIPSYNAEKYLPHCIAGVLNQSYPVDEVIVVDDGSTDRTSDVASSFSVKVLRHSTNKGLAAARNTGVRAAGNELVASLDADCVPRRNWLETLIGYMDDPKIAGTGGMLIERNHVALADRWRTRHMIQHNGTEAIVGTPFLYGHSTLFRKSALLEVGLYLESLRTNNEDHYIWKSLIDAGYRLAYEPTAIVEHLKTDNPISVSRTYWKWFFYGYHHDINFNTTTTSLLKHLLKAPKLLRTNLSEGDIASAVLSSFIVGYCCFSDFHHFLHNNGAPKHFDP